MALTNAEKQARWRARHPDVILARREAERAATAAEMIRLNPWIEHRLPSIEQAFPNLAELELPGFETVLPPRPKRRR